MQRQETLKKALMLQGGWKEHQQIEATEPFQPFQ
jgi:hypothetical protein